MNSNTNKTALAELARLMPGWSVWPERAGRGWHLMARYERRTRNTQLLAAHIEPRQLTTRPLTADRIAIFTAGMIKALRVHHLMLETSLGAGYNEE